MPTMIGNLRNPSHTKTLRIILASQQPFNTEVIGVECITDDTFIFDIDAQKLIVSVENFKDLEDYMKSNNSSPVIAENN